jgi:hypothetical protein
MRFKDCTLRVLAVAIFVWIGSMVMLGVAGLATGVWRLSDLWGHAGAAFLGEFGLIMTVGTFLLVGGPVFLWKRYELVSPVTGLACYFVYWACLGIITGAGVSALYLAIMYGLYYALAGIAVLTILEWTLRMIRVRWTESA